MSINMFKSHDRVFLFVEEEAFFVKTVFLTYADRWVTFDLTFVHFHKWSTSMMIVSKFGQNRSMYVDARAF